jgi:hypothetical protein
MSTGSSPPRPLENIFGKFRVFSNSSVSIVEVGNMGLCDKKIQQLELLTADIANAELQPDLAALATPLQEGSLT